MGIDQGGVEVEDQRPGAAHGAQPGRPGPLPSRGSGRSYGAEPVGVDRIDHPAGRRRGRHGAEEARLITQHGEVGETVAAVGQGERHVEEDPARIVTPAPTHRGRQGETQGAGQAHESATSASNRVPAWAATPLPSAVTDNDGPGGYASPWKCPSLGGICLFRSYKFPREEGLFRVNQAVFTPAS